MKRCLVAWVLGLVTFQVCAEAAAQAPDLVPLKGHVLRVLGKATRLPPRPGADRRRMTISVILNRTTPAAYDRFAKEQEGLMARGQFRPLSPKDLTDRFGPSQKSYDSVLAYLRKQGLATAGPARNRLLIAAAGTRAQVERAFGVHVDDFRLGRRLFYANDREPMVPAPLAAVIRTVWGLSNLHRWHLVGQPPDPSSATSIRMPYGVSGALPDGTDQVIGILAFNDYKDADIQARLALTGLSPAQIAAMMARLHRFLVNGPQPPDTEPELDIDGAMNIAPGASSFNVFVGPNAYAALDLTTDFPPLFNYAVEHLPSGNGARVLSFSYLDCEAAFSDAELDSVDSLIAGANLLGISFFAASGDSGAICQFDNGANATGTSFPASAPHTISVGGTTLSVDAMGGYQSERWWSGVPGGGQGGFGVSGHFPRPAYQTPLVSTPNRSVPDVSAFADPGIDICWGGCNLTLFSGTSLATPIWAAMWTLIAQTCGPSFNVASNTRLYSLPAGAFHPPSTMTPPNNDFAHLGLGSPAGPAAACCGGHNQACCAGAQPAWCNAGLTCVNGACACGGLNQYCCVPNGTCGAGLTCTGSVCLPSPTPPGQCSACSTNLTSCMAGCGTDPHHVNYCQCLCSVTACSCEQARCGSHCQPPVCNPQSN
jgi:kumamolisin